MHTLKGKDLPLFAFVVHINFAIDGLDELIDHFTQVIGEAKHRPS